MEIHMPLMHTRGIDCIHIWNISVERLRCTCMHFDLIWSYQVLGPWVLMSAECWVAVLAVNVEHIFPTICSILSLNKSKTNVEIFSSLQMTIKMKMNELLYRTVAKSKAIKMLSPVPNILCIWSHIWRHVIHVVRSRVDAGWHADWNIHKSMYKYITHQNYRKSA